MKASFNSEPSPQSDEIVSVNPSSTRFGRFWCDGVRKRTAIWGTNGLTTNYVNRFGLMRSAPSCWLRMADAGGQGCCRADRRRTDRRKATRCSTPFMPNMDANSYMLESFVPAASIAGDVRSDCGLIGKQTSGASVQCGTAKEKKFVQTMTCQPDAACWLLLKKNFFFSC